MLTILIALAGEKGKLLIKFLRYCPIELAWQVGKIPG